MRSLPCLASTGRNSGGSRPYVPAGSWRLFVGAADAQPDEGEALDGGGCRRHGEYPEGDRHLVDYKPDAEQDHPLRPPEQPLAHGAVHDLGPGARVADEEG